MPITHVIIIFENFTLISTNIHTEYAMLLGKRKQNFHILDDNVAIVL